MKLKLLAAAAVLSVAATSGFAAVLPLTTTGSATTFTGTFGASPTGASFSDTVNFTLTGPSLFSSTLTSINLFGGNDISFTLVNLTGPSAPAPGLSYTNNLSGPIELRTLTSSSLAAGTYTIAIQGTGSGSYAGAVNVSPVPEPETYALMLAGLACVGFVARRRNAG